MTEFSDEHWMRLALAEAQQSLAEDEIPVGCVIVYRDKVLSRGRRHKAGNHVSLDHAEMQALRAAISPAHQNGRGCVLYSTLEPCAMCFSTIAHTRISRVVYGLEDPEGGATNLDLQKIRRYEKEMPIVNKDILRAEVKELMKKFFQTTKHPYWSTHPDNILVKFCLE